MIKSNQACIEIIWVVCEFTIPLSTANASIFCCTKREALPISKQNFSRVLPADPPLFMRKHTE